VVVVVVVVEIGIELNCILLFELALFSKNEPL